MLSGQDGLEAISRPQVRHLASVDIRKVNMAKQIVLFIHGLFRNGEVTWGQFPELLRSDPIFSSVWEPALFSFPSPLFRVWFRTPALRIRLLAEGLRTELDTRYPESAVEQIAIVGHSLGG